MMPVYAGFFMPSISSVTARRALAMPRRLATDSRLARRRTWLPRGQLLAGNPARRAVPDSLAVVHRSRVERHGAGAGRGGIP